MIQIIDSDVIEQTDVVLTALKKSKIGAIMGDAFQRKAFPILENKVNRQYPYEVRLPKSIDEMLAGDFEPSKIIRVEKPIEGPWSHMWFGDGSTGIKLLCGYINGDSRYIFDQELGDAVVHGMLVGATGQGKSVTLNSIIYNACTLYAPWELNLTLSDAKIVEFKSIAQNCPMPHIRIVAATGDVSYLLSVLETKKDEMNKLNSVFTKAQQVFDKPVKKIEEFRKVTGLTIPQNIMIFDEFQAMFTNAKKLAGKIAQEIDAFIRLGRNTGYHLLLTSQEPGNYISKETMANITFRGAMGCDPTVSEAVLGNDKAVLNKGKKGCMIANMNSTLKNNEESNIQIKVPWCDPQTNEIAKWSIDHGHEFGVTPDLQFYDEFSAEHISEFKENLKKLPYDPNLIYLGEPSFVMSTPVKRLIINLNTTEIKNICVVSPIQRDLMRHFVMLKLNALRYKESSNIVMCADQIYSSEYGARDLTDTLFFEDKAFEGSQTFAIVQSLIYRRLLCLSTDKMVFNVKRQDVDMTESNKAFYEIIEPGSELDTRTNQLRFFYMKNLLLTDPILIKGFGNLSDESRLTVLEATLETFKAYGALDSCLTLDRVPDLNVWLLGLDKVLGVGVDAKTKFKDAIKSFMFNGKDANVRFTIFASTLDELGDLNDAIHWYILDNPLSRDLNKAKLTDDYPDQISGCQAVLADKQQPALGCQKFKKLFYDGEIAAG